MEENKSLTAQDGEFSLAELGNDFGSVIAEELGGMDGIPFDKVKIPAGGGLAFELPGENDDTPEMAKEITGVIVDHYPINAMWLSDYDGSKEQPDCASFDGKNGIDKNGETHDCASCPYNQYGSAAKGKGKRCSNKHRLFILMPGAMLPIIFEIPPTSVKNWKDYLGKKLVVKCKRSWQVVTKISLVKDKNENGIAYSKACFAKVRDLTPEECTQMARAVDGYRAITRGSALKQADTLSDSNVIESTAASDDVPTAVPKANNGGFKELGEDEALPF